MKVAYAYGAGWHDILIAVLAWVLLLALILLFIWGLILVRKNNGRGVHKKGGGATG